MPEPIQSKIITIPTGYDESTRLRIADDVITRIKIRTSEGLDVNGNFFGSYSPDYEKTGTVNLKVSGDTLQSLSVISTGPGFIRIGYSAGISNDKASYLQAPRGRKTGKQPRREFVGISTPDLNTILERYPL